MKISVATLFLFAAFSAAPVNAQLSNPGTIFRGQTPPMMVQGVTPESALTPGYPLPAPANLQPEVVDGSQPWNAFSPPTAPIPPGATAPGLGAPMVGAPLGTSPYGSVPYGSAPIGAAPSLPAPSAGLQGGAYGDPFGQLLPPDQSLAAPAYSNQMMGQPYSAFQPALGQDPFLTQQQMANPFAGGVGGAPMGFTIPGANGPQPYRFGWQQRVNLQWLPDESVSGAGATGNFGWFGVDYQLQWTQQMPGWIFISRPQFGFRAWDGPRGLSLPNGVYRFGYEVGMETPRNGGPYSFMLSATPSFNSDLDGNNSGDAWNLDGKGALFFQLDQYWQLALGVQYWDRVDDRLLPYGGLIYTDDFWEWRLTFPEARASLFLGSEYMWAKWLYVRGEYHAEAYEVETKLAGVSNRQQIEIRDWRALIGLKMDTGHYDWFFEGGWVFGRDVMFSEGTPSFSIGTGFIGQLGFRF